MLEVKDGGIFQTKGIYEDFPTPLRVTKCYELEVYAPCGSLLMINGEKYTHAGYAVFLFPPGTERCSLGPFSCAFLHFTADDADCAAYLAALPTCTALETDSAFRARCLEIAACRTDTPRGRLEQQQLLLALLLALGQQAAREPQLTGQTQKYSKNLMAAKKYMDENFGEKITLETLCRITFLSKNFFRTLFSAHFGISPAEYLLKVRIGHAVTLFRTGTMPFSEIALFCGFGSQAYMNAVIKRRTGRTPLSYRKKPEQ